MRESKGLKRSREQKMALIYMRATGSDVEIFDCDFQPLDADGKLNVEKNICRYCSGNCQQMHTNAIRESGAHGSSHIYQCELGLMFWVSPIFSEGKFSGVLRGSGYLNNTIDDAALAQKCSGLCNGTIPPDALMRNILILPAVDTEKIRSLSEMLLLCAESLSHKSENHHEILRLRARQRASLSVLVEELQAKHPKGTTIPYPFDKERQLIASLHQGDKKEMEKILNEVLAILIFSNPNHFRYIQLRAMELAVLILRAGISSSGNSAAEINTRYLKQIQEATTVEELTGILHTIMENMAGHVTSIMGIPHALALRKAEAFIRENLTRKISLREIAKVAGLSAPYFSTIFKEEMGENLSRYINRLRVEKASKMLLETNSTLSSISAACCFEDQSWFSKIFKSFTGISPGKYRSQGGNIVSPAASSAAAPSIDVDFFQYADKIGA